MQKDRVTTLKHIAIITAAYMLAHFFLLILSGCWWDDWTFMRHDLEYVHMVASQSGRPEWDLLIPLCWSSTNNGRVLIFFIYYLISIFLYVSLKNSKIFDEIESLIITLIFTVIPVNESRLLISNFPYTIGLLFFYFALMLFIKWNNGVKRIIPRICILLLFLISFILNSLLAFFYIIFIYLFIIELRKNKEKKALNRVIISTKNILIKYIDFFILPFIFFIGNKVLFPITDSNFVARSSITINGVLKCFKYIPLSILNIIKQISTQFIKCLSNWFVLLLCTIVIFIIIIFCKKNKRNSISPLLMVLFGLIVLVLGVFAYVEIRSGTLSSIGVKGRDTILVPFGLSLIIFGLVSSFNNKIKIAICSIVILLGILSFNLLYIEWQKDYYYQLSMENLLDNEVVKNNDTFFLADLNESNVKGQRYYSLNINANHVFNDETRFFIPKVSNLYMLKSKKDIDNAKQLLKNSYAMKDYNPDDYYLDAIIIYKNNLDWKDVIKLKYLEMFDFYEFIKKIDNLGEMETIEVDNGFTMKLLEEFDKGNINSDIDVVNLLEVYYNNY